jgi:hypothetical protein
MSSSSPSRIGRKFTNKKCHDLNVIELDGTEYVVVPKKEYDRLRGQVPAGSVDAIQYANAAIAADLKTARETAKLTQGQLAKKMGRGPRLQQRLRSQQPGELH